MHCIFPAAEGRQSAVLQSVQELRGAMCISAKGLRQDPWRPLVPYDALIQKLESSKMHFASLHRIVITM